MSGLIPQFEIEEVSLGTVELEHLKRYAVAAGDPNPIHQDEAIAKAMGLPGIIAHGMYVAGLLHSHALTWVSGQPIFTGVSPTLTFSKIRFRAMTLLGDEIRVSGQGEHSNASEWRLDLAAKNQKGETLVTCQLHLKI